MSDPMPATDVLRPFLLESTQLRGRMVRLDDSLNRVLSAHNYPKSISAMLAELLLLAGGLAGGLKFQGTFSLQIRGGGPVNLMVAEMRNDGVLRGYASFEHENIGEKCDLEGLFGKGVLAMTVDQRPSGGEVYQGIVELEKRSLRDAMLGYFRQSEQVPTGIQAAIRHDPIGGRWSGSAVIVQAMPGDAAAPASNQADDWRRTMMLLDSATDEELLDPALPIDQILYRLFHEDGVRVFDQLPIEFGCTCSEDRVRIVLSRFEPNDLDGMIKPDGNVHVTCEFCNSIYQFDRDEVLDILKSVS